MSVTFSCLSSQHTVDTFNPYPFRHMAPIIHQNLQPLNCKMFRLETFYFWCLSPEFLLFHRCMYACSSLLTGIVNVQNKLSVIVLVCAAVGCSTLILDVAGICGKNRKYPLFCETHPAYRTTGTGVRERQNSLL